MRSKNRGAFWQGFLKWTAFYVVFVLLDWYTHQQTTLHTLLAYLFALGISIVNVEYLVPHLLNRKKHIYYLAGLALMTLLFAVTKFLMQAPDLHLQAVFIPAVVMIGASMMLHLIIEWSTARQKIVETQNELLASNLNSLKAQLNPHFFFNSINNIYHLIDIDREEAKEAMMRMSTLLRFQMEECQNQFITTDQEIRFLTNYIEFESLRKRNEVKVSFNTSACNRTIQIPPLLLMPFVENAFKHVSRRKNGDENLIELSLATHDGQIHFMCKNTFDGQDRLSERISPGIGLANVTNRLKLIYENRFSLSIAQKDNWYTVELRLPC